MFRYLQVLINKKDKYKDKRKIQIATQTYKKWSKHLLSHSGHYKLSTWASRRLYSGAEGWYNLNAHG